MKTFVRRAARSDFTRSGALVFGGVLAGQGLNFAYLLFLGRTLSVPDYGAVLSLVSAVALVVGVAGVVQTVTAKLAADLRAADDPQRMAAFWRAISRLSRWVAGGFALAIFAMRQPIAGYLHLDHPELVAIAGAAAGVGLAMLFQRGCLQGFGAFRSLGISSLTDGGRAVVVIPLAHALGAMGTVLAMLASITATALYGELVLYRRFAAISGEVHLDIRRIARTAAATGLSSFGIMMLMFYDVVLARHFLNPVDSALYGAAALAGRVIYTVISFLPIVLLPHVTLRASRGDAVMRYLLAGVALTVVVIAPITIVAAFAPQLVIRVIAGSRFTMSAPLLLPYVLAAAGLAFANLLSAYAVGRHRFGFVPYVLFVAFCEVVAVILRHGSSREIIQDVLAGHSAVCCTMIVWFVHELLGSGPRDIRVATGEPPSSATPRA